jgi:hypothetical protein
VTDTIDRSSGDRSHASVSLLEPGSNLFVAAVARLRDAHGVLECWLRGGSMGQAIPAGSRFRIAFVDPSSYRAGQVVAFLAAGRIYAHRIVYRGRWRAARNILITRGDRCLLPDFPVDVAAVLGAVTHFSVGNGIWAPPGQPERRSLVARVISYVADAILAVLIEIHAMLAKWLLARLRKLVRYTLSWRTPVSRPPDRGG